MYLCLIGSRFSAPVHVFIDKGSKRRSSCSWINSFISADKNPCCETTPLTRHSVDLSTFQSSGSSLQLGHDLFVHFLCLLTRPSDKSDIQRHWEAVIFIQKAIIYLILNENQSYSSRSKINVCSFMSLGLCECGWFFIFPFSQNSFCSVK